MKISLHCYPCLLRQTLQAIRMTGVSEEKAVTILNESLETLAGIDRTLSPVEVARQLQRSLREISGNPDPFAAAKQESNQRAAACIAENGFLEELDSPRDALELAARLAIAGNIIDYGPGHAFDLQSTLTRCQQLPFTVDHLDLLAQRLQTSRSLAFFADNAGEIYFDKLLLEVIRRHFPIREMLLIVRAEPFLNDALKADARAAGFADIPGLRIAGMGPGIPPPEDPSHAVWQEALAADLRIAKGMANAESFDTLPDFFLLFILKCEVVTRQSNLRALNHLARGDRILLHTDTARS